MSKYIYLVILSILLLVSISLNAIQFYTEQTNTIAELETTEDKQVTEEPKGLHYLEAIVETKDFTWEGRISEIEGKDDEVLNYKLVRIDKQGKEEIMYDTEVYTFNPTIEFQTVQSSPQRNTLKLIETKGGTEGGETYTTFFENGEKKSTSYINYYGPYAQSVKFQVNDSPEYSVELVSTGECIELQKSDNEYDILTDKTDLTGIKVTSDDYEEIFDIPVSINIPCSYIDGITEPHIRSSNVTIYGAGITISLPILQNAYISLDENKNPQISFH